MQETQSRALTFGVFLASVTNIEVVKTNTSFLACGAWYTG